MNEAFKRKYSSCLTEAIDESDKARLKKALILDTMSLIANGGATLKSLEITMQRVIEDMFPDKAWWEVTDCQIFMSLMGNGGNARQTIDEIVDQMKDTSDENNSTDTITESSDQNGTGRAVLKTFIKNKGVSTSDDMDYKI